MSKEKLDILAFAAHPDDVEISVAGTLLKSVALGQKVGIVDFTGGELGSRGSKSLRSEEAANASRILGIQTRDNLGLRDGFFEHTEESIRLIIEKIRLYQPQIVLCTAPTDRHPDHGRASKMVREACFYSGLRKIETLSDGKNQEPWRPKAVYQYIQDQYLKPDFVIDITEYWDKKIEVLQCFESQFYNANSKEPKTPISGEEFFEFLRGRALQFGRPAGFKLAEGFIADRTPGVSDLTSLI